MEKTERKYKEGTRVQTPDGTGEVWEYALGFYSVFVDGNDRCAYYKEEQLILLEDQTPYES